MLKRIGEALAGIQILTVAECERAFNCKLQLINDLPEYSRRDYRGRCPDFSIKLLDVRITRKGGIIVANIDERVQEGLVQERKALGKPDAFDSSHPDIVLSPVPTEPSEWAHTWHFSYIIDGVKITYSVDETVDGSERLVSVSRKFNIL